MAAMLGEEQDGSALPGHETRDSPCFLVGAERSGTTLLRLMLDHHPEIAWHSEFEFAVDEIADSGAWPDVGDYCALLETDRVFQTNGHIVDRTLSYPDLIKSFLAQNASAPGIRVSGATVHRHFDRLLHIWPDARFIHIVRDPRDVASSAIGMGWAGNHYCAAGRWLEAEQLWESMSARVPASRRIELRYEDLLQDPDSALNSLCTFLGTTFHPDMLTYDTDTTYDRPDPKHVQKWRRHPGSAAVQQVESRTSGLLKKYGYELGGQPIRDYSLLERSLFRLEDKWGRIRFRARRYGLLLLAADFAARRAGLKRLSHRLLLRKNAIDARYVR